MLGAAITCESARAMQHFRIASQCFVARIVNNCVRDAMGHRATHTACSSKALYW